MAHILPTIQDALKNCGSDPVLPDAAKGLLEALGYVSERVVETDGTLAAFIEKFEADNLNTESEKRFLAAAKSVHFLFQFGNSEISNQNSGNLSLGFNEYEENNINSFVFFAVELKKDSYSRGEYAEFTREINKRVRTPSVVLFRCGGVKSEKRSITLSFIERRRNKRDTELDVLKKVSLLREIQCNKPHRGHLNILEQLTINERLKWMKDNNQIGFDGLLKAWLDELDAEALNRRFYKDLLAWFESAVDEVKFPSPPESNKEHLMRMISRMLFIWFMKEKEMINRDLFVELRMKEVLNNHDWETGDSYYRAILQNLFFATLNTEISKRKFSKVSQETHRDFSLYRYHDLMAAPEKIIAMMKQTPFVNGGLFDCLDDHESGSEGGSRIDCFSDNIDHRKLMSVPNALFFGTGGLFDIFNKYKFTVEENTPIEQEVALDPELLGKVFENLLVYVNRRETGSYYTPRVIVDYMVRESLTAYFVRAITSDTECLENRVRALLSADREYETHLASEQFSESEIKQFVAASGTLRLLDPAVGSGAFLMGALAQLTMALLRIDPENRLLRERELERAQISPVSEVRKRTEIMVKEVFSQKNKYNNYGRKLSLIRDSLFGVDIQPIAIQICRLRFFISLLIEQQPNDNPKNNFGIRPLPNMETKTIAADTLVGIAPPDLFSGSGTVKELVAKLLNIRRNFFDAQFRDEKRKYRKQDQVVRKELADFLTKHNYPSDDAQKIARWDLYDPTISADWFDAKWMFGISDGFNIVIGNPPYVKVEHLAHEMRYLLKQQYGWHDDLYVHFIHKAHALTRENGTFSYIANDSFLRFHSKQRVRNLLLDCQLLKLVKCPEATFDATIYTAIFLAVKTAPSRDHFYASGEMEAPDYQYQNSGNVTYSVVSGALNGRLFYASPMLNIYLKICNCHKTVGDFLATLDTGIDSGNVRNKIFFTEQKYPPLHPMLQGKQMGHYFLNWNSPQAKYKYCDISYEPLPVRGIGRGGELSKHNEYWTFRGNKENHHKPERLLMRQTGDKFVVAYHNEQQSGQFYTDNTLFTILPKSSEINLKCAMAILNSKLLLSLYQFISQEGKKTLAQVKVNVVNAMPFPAMETSTQHALAELADKIIIAKSKNPDADTNAQEAEIDTLVYKLYGITEAEQKIIESE